MINHFVTAPFVAEILSAKCITELRSWRWGRGQKVGPIDRGVRRSIYVFA